MKTKLLQIFSLLLLAGCIASCSNSKTGKLLERVPESAEMVCVGDIKTMLESAGGSIEKGQIKLPDFVTDAMSARDSEKIDELIETVKDAGINPDAAAFYIHDNNDVALFTLSDREKFISYIKDEDFEKDREEDGITFYSKTIYSRYYDGRYYVVAIDGDFAYFDEVRTEDDEKPYRSLKKLVEKGKDSSISKLDAAKYIAEGNGGGFLVRIPKEAMEEMRGGIYKGLAKLCGMVALKWNLNKEDLTLNLKIFDREGKAVKGEDVAKVYKATGSIDTAALEYFNQNEIFVTAYEFDSEALVKMLGEMSEDSYGEERQLTGLLTTTLKKLEGTQAIGLGVKGGLQGLFDLAVGEDLTKLEGTVVLHAKSGKASSVVADLQAMMDLSGMPYEQTGKQLTITLPENSGEIYIKADGDFVVISNRKIEKPNDSPAVMALDYGKYPAAGAIVFNKDNKIVSDLDLKNAVSLVWYFEPKDMELTMTLKIDGDSKQGVIANAAAIVEEIISQKSRFNRMEEESYRKRMERYEMYTVVEPEAVDTNYTEDYWMGEEAVVAEEPYY